MLLHEALKRTGLTRKAVDYYIAQGLISPKATENGYRVFNEEDVARLKAIAAYRKLGIGAADIQNILDGNERQILSHILLRRTLDAKQEEKKRELLASLASGTPIHDLSAQLDALDAQATIADKLLFAFPGYFGDYIALHFSFFLQEPIKTEIQRQAYDTIVRWMDALPPLDLPDDLSVFLKEASQDITVQHMGGIHEAVLSASENPEAYFKEHKDVIRSYMTIRDTDEYKASPAARLMEHMKAFQIQSGYTEVFLPAMEQLSPAYKLYRDRLSAASEVLAQTLK